MAKKRSSKEQIIIDLKYKEIKGTNKTILKQLTEILNNDISFTEYFNLDSFKVVASLTEDKQRAPKNFKPITYKTRKRDIISYLETIKDSNRQIYDEYMTALKEDDFVVVNKKFNEEVVTTEEEINKLQEIIEQNNILVEQERQEKERIRKIKEKNREERQKKKDEKKKNNTL